MDRPPDRVWRVAVELGVTLLEMLVVVAIISLLIATLLPALTAARAEVRRLACQASLQQLHLAWSAYLEVHKGFFPSGMNMEYNYGGLQGDGSRFFGKDPAVPVPKVLNRFVGVSAIVRSGGEMFACPDDKGTDFIRPSARWYYGTSYFPNHLLVGRNIWVPPGYPCEQEFRDLVGNPWAWPMPTPGLLDRFNQSKIDNPTQLILIGDYSWLDHWDNCVPQAFPFWHRRKGMHNMSFMDGHGGFVPVRKGIHVDSRYSIVPFKPIRARMLQCQQEIVCP